MTWGRAAFVLIVACAFYAALAVESLARKSLTLDETVYIPAGALMVRAGDFVYNAEQPPVPKLLAGLAQSGLSLDFPQPFDLKVYLKANAASIEAWTLHARLPLVALGALTIVGIFLFASIGHGPSGGAAAALLAAFCPNLLAHGGLVTGDLPAACFGVWMGLFFVRWMTRPSIRNLLGLSIACGLAATSKFTALVLPLLFLVAAPWMGAGTTEDGPSSSVRTSFKRAVLGLGGMIPVALFVVWGVYGFQSGPLRPLLPPDMLPTEGGWVARLLALSVPAPSFWHGLWKTWQRGGGEYAYLFGKVSYTGWWYYYPVCLLVKSPLSFLAGLALWTARAVRRRGAIAPAERLAAVCIVGLLIFFAAQNVDLGFRYLLPLIPYSYALLGGVLGDLAWTAGLRRAAAGLLLAGQVAATLAVRPDYLTFFNRLAGGSEGGRRILSDSNLDWGQDLPGLRDALARRGIDTVYLATSSNVDPSFYGIRYHLLPSPFFRRQPRPGDVTGCGPVAGWVAIGATVLSGVHTEPGDCYRWLDRYRPVEVIGGSILLFHIPQEVRGPG